VEDISEGWTKAGTVGQEVYGAAAPLVFSTRHCFQVGDGGLVLRCDYPVRMDYLEGDERAGAARLRVLGDARCRCELRVVADHTTPLPEVELAIERGRRPVKGELVEFGGIAFDLPGDAVASVSWRTPAGLREPSNCVEEVDDGDGHREGAETRDREEAHN
jgi:hypothetical protein